MDIKIKYVNEFVKVPSLIEDGVYVGLWQKDEIVINQIDSNGWIYKRIVLTVDTILTADNGLHLRVIVKEGVITIDY